MTELEFREKAEKEDWAQEYVENMLKIVDNAKSKGINFLYEIILPPGPLPVA